MKILRKPSGMQPPPGMGLQSMDNKMPIKIKMANKTDGKPTGPIKHLQIIKKDTI